MNKNTIFSKNFTLVVIGQIISIFGNQMLRYALPLYLLNQTGSSAVFGGIQALSFIPMLLLFPIGGILADRVNKRNIMVLLDFATAVLIFVFAQLSNRVDIVLLIAVTMILLYGIQGAYQPAVKASVPTLVASDQMMRANSVVDTIDSVASMAGPIIGGLLFSVFGLTTVLTVSGSCFLAASVMEIFIHIPFKKAATTENIVVTGLQDLKASFHFIIKTQPLLWKTALIFTASNFLLTTLVLIGLPVIITQHLQFSPDTANRLYGYAQGVVASGAVLGGVIAGVTAKRLTTKSGPLLLIGCSCAIIASGLALQTATTPLAGYIGLLIGCGLLLTLHTVFQIQTLTNLQRLTPTHLIGKVISCFMCIVMCTTPLGQFMYGLSFEKISTAVYLPFYVAGTLMIILTILTRSIFTRVSGT